MLGNGFETAMTGCPRSGKKSGSKYFFKVRELSLNFDISQGILHFQPKVREMSESFEITLLLKIAKDIKNND